SHELRTPLNSMLLLSNLLAENEAKNLTGKQVEFARTIHSAGKDLLQLINQVLDLARVESGKRAIVMGTVKLEDVVDRARRLFEPLARERGLTFECGIDAGLPESIRSDAQAIEQVVTN